MWRKRTGGLSAIIWTFREIGMRLSNRHRRFQAPCALSGHFLLVSHASPLSFPPGTGSDLLGECIDGVLHRTDYGNFEVLIVDNGSVEPATLRLFDRLSSEESRVRILCYPGPVQLFGTEQCCRTRS